MKKYRLEARYRGAVYHWRKDGVWHKNKDGAAVLPLAKARKAAKSLLGARGCVVIAVPASDSIRKNPSRRESVEQADSLLESFTGERATKELRVRERPIKTGLVIGKLQGVHYQATRDGETADYYHKFKAKSRPLLITSYDGTTLSIVGGQYRFTDRGIVDT